ncbi:MAG: ferrochelatase [Chloroflexi bacterium]|nr:ferrochelatase [Chloroflexota bacterium]MCY4248276.1 ferrochelatase [Chloroflexota bacterium]
MKTGVLLAQLGTPAAPTAKALRPYLRQFLSDRRVIDYHPLLWKPILHGIILRARPRRSARLYKRIWTDAGSPLLLYTQAQVAGLRARLGADFHVLPGMTYGEPSIKTAIQSLEGMGIERIIVLPMFPQFSSTTTSCVYDAVYRAAAGSTTAFGHDHKRFTPALRFVAPWYNHPGYIRAMQKHLQRQIGQLDAQPDRFVISFHGIPLRYIQTGDPYRQHCEITADLLAAAMGWGDDDWTLSFQSRFGPEAWLEPYTEDVLESLPAQGIERPFVFSPGFVTDCLETLDELGNEGREQFERGGGDPSAYHLAPCLNDNKNFLDCLAELTRENAVAWGETPTRPATPA